MILSFTEFYIIKKHLKSFFFWHLIECTSYVFVFVVNFILITFNCILINNFRKTYNDFILFLLFFFLYTFRFIISLFLHCYFYFICTFYHMTFFFFFGSVHVYYSAGTVLHIELTQVWKVLYKVLDYYQYFIINVVVLFFFGWIIPKAGYWIYRIGQYWFYLRIMTRERAALCSVLTLNRVTQSKSW